MKFSVMLPTRNRLDLLSNTIETVRRQNYSDWEIIVFDNFSEEDIVGYVQSLNDPRIKCYRTDKFVPVTDNWNNALAKSNGDYVIMLGDDDGLMQGYFSTLKKVIEEYDAPDFIYTSAFLFAYPGVMPGFPDGFLRPYGRGKIYRNARKPFWLEKSESVALVNHSINFRTSFTYNAQVYLVSRKLIQDMGKYGSFYQSPYPDVYAANALMFKAKRILIVPQPLVTIGISPKSFGFYYYNDLERKGNEFLKNIPDHDMTLRLQQVILPGTDSNTSWLLSMESLAKNFGDEGNLRVNYARYRLRQICVVYARLVLSKYGAKQAIISLKCRMTIRERNLYGVPLSIAAAMSLIIPKRYRALMASLINIAPDRRLIARLFFDAQGRFAPKVKGKFITILDVFEKIAPVSDSVKKKE